MAASPSTEPRSNVPAVCGGLTPGGGCIRALWRWERRAGSHRVFPLDVQQVRNTDGGSKQGGEVNAGKRPIERFRPEHRQMLAIVSRRSHHLELG